MPNSEIAHLSILLVEDVRATRMIVRAILHSFGIYDIVEAADGEEALAMLSQRHIDVVITDLVMQPMDGVQFTRRLRTPRNGLNNYVPILMVSGHTDIANVKDAIAAGVTEFLVKPIVPAIWKRACFPSCAHPRSGSAPRAIAAPTGAAHHATPPRIGVVPRTRCPFPED